MRWWCTAHLYTLMYWIQVRCGGIFLTSIMTSENTAAPPCMCEHPWTPQHDLIGTAVDASCLDKAMQVVCMYIMCLATWPMTRILTHYVGAEHGCGQVGVHGGGPERDSGQHAVAPQHDLHEQQQVCFVMGVPRSVYAPEAERTLQP